MTDFGTKNCEACGILMSEKKYPNSREGITQFRQRRFCSRLCAVIIHRKQHPTTRQAHLCRVRHLRKMSCEKCGATTSLHLHHRDKNWANDSATNIQTLCATCHLKLHWADGDMVAKLPPRPCSGCGRVSNRSTCSSCTYRKKHNGDPRIAKRLINGCWTKHFIKTAKTISAKTDVN